MKNQFFFPLFIVIIIISLSISFFIINNDTEFKLKQSKLKHMGIRNYYLGKKVEYFDNDTLYNYYNSLYKKEENYINFIDSILIFN